MNIYIDTTCLTKYTAYCSNMEYNYWRLSLGHVYAFYGRNHDSCRQYKLGRNLEYGCFLMLRSLPLPLLHISPEVLYPLIFLNNTLLPF